MVRRGHADLSISAQCRTLLLHRSGPYHKPKGETELNLELMRLMDEHYLYHPEKGAKRMHAWLTRDKRHKAYPYLSKGLKIERPNQVWATDITYIPMKKGYVPYGNNRPSQSVRCPLERVQFHGCGMVHKNPGRGDPDAWEARGRQYGTGKSVHL